MKAHASYLPLYFRLAEDLKSRIDNGELKPGDMIPSTAELARLYGASHMTVRQGISLLMRDGYVETVRGKGSFVTAPRMETLLLHLSENQVLGDAHGLTINLLELDIVSADELLSGTLKVERGTRILKMKRLLSGEKGPVSVDERYVPYIKGAPLLEKEIKYTPFPALVASHTELTTVRATMKVSARPLSAGEAGLLKAEEGRPALCMEQIIYAANSRPIGWSKMTCRSDRFTLTAVSQPL